jgi:hypothetical protein
MNCVKCGKCCLEGDHWQRSQHHAIVAMVEAWKLTGRKFAKGVRCLWHQDNKCMIEYVFGNEAKPETCKEYFCDKETEQ